MNNLEKYKGFAVYAIWGGIFMLLLTPFVVVKSMYFPYVAGKGFYFRIIVEIIAVLYLFVVAIDKSFLPKRSLTLYVLLGLLLSLCISNIFGPDTYKSFFSNYERMEGFVNVAHLVILFIVSNSVIQTKKSWDYILNFSLITSFLVNAYSVLQLAGYIKINQGGVRVDGPFGNASYLAMYALIHIFIALYFVFRSQTEQYKKIIYIALALFSFYILFMTATRGAMLGLVFGLITSGLFLGIRVQNRETRIFAGIALAVIVFLFAGVFMFKGSSIIKSSDSLTRLSNISLSDSTAMSRFTIWGMSLEGLKEKPIFGWGQENFNYVFNSHYKPSLFTQEEWFDRAHNLVFDWFVTGGLFGGILYLSLFAWAVYYIWKREDFEIGEKAVLIGLVCGYFFQNLFVFDNPTSYTLFFLLLAFVTVGKNFEWKEENERGQISATRYALLSVFALIFLYVSFVITVKPIVTNITLIKTLEEYNNYRAYSNIASSMSQNPSNQNLVRGDIVKILENKSVPDEIKAILSRFKKGNKTDNLGKILSEASLESANTIPELMQKIINQDTFGITESREQFAQLAVSVIREKDFPAEAKEKIYQISKAEMYKHMALSPLNARNYMIGGMFFAETGNLQLSIEHLKKALELSPQKQSIMLQLGAIYAQANMMNEAVEMWKKASELDGRFPTPKIAYAGGLLINNQKEEAMIIINDLLKNESDRNALYMNDQFARILPFAKEYKLLVDLLKYRIEKDPDDINRRMSLVVTYFDANMKTDAIKELEEIKTIFPDFSTTADKYIKDIKNGKRPE